MILSVGDLMTIPEFNGQDGNIKQKKLDAVELLIRKYTNNNAEAPTLVPKSKVLLELVMVE